MGNYSFKQDMVLGDIGQKVVADFLEQNGGKVISQNHDNRYDLEVSYKNEIITYEVKTDVFCAPIADTGNLFIEFESRNKPSGISVTQAKWFVTYFLYLNEMWFIESDDLRKLISENESPINENSGDINSNTKGYLINRKKFKQYFKVCQPNSQ